MDENASGSPTGMFGLRTFDLLTNSCSLNNAESVRQLSLHARLAEEKYVKYRSLCDELKLSYARLAKTLKESEDQMQNMRNEFEERLESERHQREKDRKDNKARFDSILAFFTSASQIRPMCELENAAIVKKTLVDASTEICGVSAINEDVNNIWQGSYLNPNIVKKECGVQAVVEEADIQKFSVSQISDSVQIQISHFDQIMEEKSRFENQNFFLETQLKLAKNKLSQHELKQAEKLFLENRLVILSDTIDNLVKENERLKELLAIKSMNIEGSAEIYQDVNKSSQDHTNLLRNSRSIVNLNIEYQAKLDALNSELNLKNRKLEEQIQSFAALSMNYETLKNEHELFKQSCESKTNAECGVNNENNNASIEIIRKYEMEIAELRELLEKYEASSETTKILHYRSNPLDLAHKEYQEFQLTKKRRQEISHQDLDSSIRQKYHDELIKQISDLQYQLHKVEKEKSSALLIQSDLVKKYRAAATALSGFQIKLKEDDLVQVESIFDPGNYFVFKVENLGKSISLLETEYAKQWAKEIREYLEGQNSTPSFLAAITLTLSQRPNYAHSYNFISFNSSD